ncbi:hypothetical protein PV403_24320, partial [Paenibacillus sp. GYB006]|uniref:hypothetical protein n=1 Tax=Paenibacillus sp. GYB006 TaxID=2994394 RepID=UPI002F96D2A0
DLKSSETPPEIYTFIIQKIRMPFLNIEERHPDFRYWTFSVASQHTEVISLPLKQQRILFLKLST